MTAFADTTVDLARIQFATTSLYHFLFVPLTLGLAPLVATMQANQAGFMRAAKLALIVLLPVSAINLGLGREFGVLVTDQQPMKISAVEAPWNTRRPCGFDLPDRRHHGGRSASGGSP